MPRAALACLLLVVCGAAESASAQRPAVVGPSGQAPDAGRLFRPPGFSASADGRFVAFETTANLAAVNLPDPAPETRLDVYVRDLQTGTLTLVSVNAAGTAAGNGDSNLPQISADGRRVVFTSRAHDLEGSGAGGLFIRDLEAGTTARVGPGGPGGVDDSAAFISPNGRVVAYKSGRDIYAYDVETGTTELATPLHAGGASDATSSLPVIVQGEPGYRSVNRDLRVLSDDGRFLVFVSLATNLVAQLDEGFDEDIFVRDLQNDTTTLVSVNSAGTAATGSFAVQPTISGDGKRVAFASRSKFIIPDTPGGFYELFLRDLAAGTTELVSVRAAGLAPNGNDSSGIPSLSADGRFVAFGSSAPNLVPNDTNGAVDVFVRDTLLDTTTLVSVNSAGAASGNGQSTLPQISADGRRVAFQSVASDLDAAVAKHRFQPGNAPAPDVYVRDLEAGTTRQLSVDHTGTRGGDGTSYGARITAGGEIVFFEGAVPNLAPGSTNTVTNYFAALTRPSALTFGEARYDAAEADPSVTVTVVRNGPADAALTFDYATQDATARAGLDYAAASGTLTFAPGETSKTITVELLGDAGKENTETFHLLVTDFAHQNAPTALATAVVAILDDDADASPPIISVADATAAEGFIRVSRPITFTVTLSVAATEPITFSLTGADGTATQEDGDYFVGPFPNSFTIPAGQTSRTFTTSSVASSSVTVKGDNKFEPDESFTLSLTNVTNATVGDGEAVVSVPNDDPAPTIIANDQTITEAGNASVTFPGLFLSNPSYLPVTVRAQTADGTARAPGDYEPRSGTFTIPAGQTTASAQLTSVRISGDSVAEPTETFSVVLSDAVNATIADPEGVVTVFDDDTTTVGFQFESSLVLESGFAEITVERIGPTGGTVTVDYTISDGTATAGSDFAAATGTLTFGPGETSKKFSFAIQSDEATEGTETVVLTLSNPTGGAQLGRVTTANVSIIDDDGCTYTLIPSAYPQFSAAGVTSYPVGVARPSGCNVSVSSSHADLTFDSVSNSSPWVHFNLAPNLSAAARSIPVRIGDQTLFIHQAGTNSGSAFELESPAYFALESARGVEVKVLRRGDTNGPASACARSTTRRPCPATRPPRGPTARPSRAASPPGAATTRPRSRP